MAKVKILETEYTKGDFGKKISSIIENHRAGSKLIGKPAEFILECTKRIDKWATVSYRADVEVRLVNQQIGPRKVKMIALRSTSDKGNGRHDVLIPKNKLVDSLFPAKKRESTTTPENEHFKKVRSAMRNAVSYQMKKARENIDWQYAECCNTGKKLRKGQSIDIDHWGTCFAELCDSWLAFEGLTYCDVVLAGTPNNKRIKDRELEKSWVNYHYQRANLRPSLAAANRSKGSSEYLTEVSLIGSFKSTEPDEIDLDF
jgi:hypothetical protein